MLQESQIHLCKPPAFPEKSAHNDTEALYKDKRTINIIMDSNRKFISFKGMLLTEEEETDPVVIPCGNIKRAEEILKTNQIDSPHQIILHIGINDIDTQDTRDIAVKLKTLAEAYQTRFNCEVFISGVTPRADQYNSHVNTVNKELRHHLSNSMVKRISHENLNPSHLHDDRHLGRNKTHGELLSGVQLCARKLFESITNKPMAPQKIQKSCDKLRNHHLDITLNLGMRKGKNQIFILKRAIEVLAIKIHSK